MLRIPKRVEYALLACVHLARQPGDGCVPLRSIADSQDVPAEFMAKILRSLSSSGIVESVRGAHGGYRLGRPPSSVTFLEIVEAADSPIALNDCSIHGEGCVLSPQCSMRTVWRRGEDAMRDVFASVRLSDLACESELLEVGVSGLLIS